MDTHKRQWIFGFAAIVALIMGAMPTMAFAQGATTGSSKNYSFYPTAAAAAVYADTMIGNDRVAEMGDLLVGEISGAAGFADLDVVDKTVGEWHTFIQSFPSKNTASYSYDAFAGQITSSGPNAAQRFVEYGRFGRLLAQLGLDSTGDSGIADSGRKAIGSVLQFVWYIANGADSVIKWCYDILQTLNPFRFLANTAIGHGSAGTIGTLPGEGGPSADIEESYLENSEGKIDGVTAGPALQNVLDFITMIYNWCYRNTWIIIIPVLAALMIFLFLVGNNRNRAWSIGKRIALTLALVGLAVPVWGVAYTAVLTHMSALVQQDMGMSGDGISPANRVILSTLVDTAGWARTGFDTTGIGLKSTTETINGALVTTDQPTTDTVNNLRSVVLAINKKTMNLNEADMPGAGGTLGGSAALGIEGGGGDTDGGREAAQELLTSYIDGYMYESAQYESYIKGGEVNAAAMATWLQATSNPEAYAEGLSQLRGNESEEAPEIVDNGLLRGNAPKTANSVANNAELQELYDELSHVSGSSDGDDEIIAAIKEILEKEHNASDNDGEFGEDGESALATITWFGTRGSSTSTNSLTPKGNLNVTYSGNEGQWSGSLSAIGTYNFLNTRFDSNGFTVYSSAKSANTQSRVSHYASSLAGGSVLGLLFGANSVILLLAFGITAIVYGLSLLFSNLGRAAKMLVSLPAASLGMLGSLARVFVVACMMIAELIATGMCYVIMRGVLFALNEFLVGELGTFVAGLLPSSAGVASVSNALFTPLMLILSTVLLILYIVMAIRLRGAITGAISEGLTSLMNRITGVAAKDSPSHAFGKIAQGALIGGALMGGAGGATGLMAGAGVGGMVLNGLANAGKQGDTINGDVIGDANASQSSIDNSQHADTTSQQDGNTANNIDKDAGDTSLLGGQQGVEGGERQSGLGLLSGSVMGSLAGIGSDAGMNDAMRTPAEDLGSANRLATNEFGYNAQSGDEYKDATELGAAYGDQMKADTANIDSATAGDVSGDTLTAASLTEGARSDATNYGYAMGAGNGQMTANGYDAYGTAPESSAETAQLAGAYSDMAQSAEGRMDSATADNVFAAQTASERFMRESTPEAAELSGTYGNVTNYGDTAAGTGQMSANMQQAAYGYGGEVDSSAMADVNAEGANVEGVTATGGNAEGAQAELYGVYGSTTNYGETAAGTGQMDTSGASLYGYGSMTGDVNSTMTGNMNGTMTGAMSGDMTGSADMNAGTVEAGNVDANGQVMATGDFTADGEMHGLTGQMTANADLFGSAGIMQPMGDQSSMYDIHGDNAWQDVNLPDNMQPTDQTNPQLDANMDADLGDVTAYGTGGENPVTGENADAVNLFDADYGQSGMYGSGAEGIDDDARQVYSTEGDTMLEGAYAGGDSMMGAASGAGSGVEMREPAAMADAPQISVMGPEGGVESFGNQSGSDYGRTPTMPGVMNGAQPDMVFDGMTSGDNGMTPGSMPSDRMGGFGMNTGSPMGTPQQGVGPMQHTFSSSQTQMNSAEMRAYERMQNGGIGAAPAPGSNTFAEQMRRSTFGGVGADGAADDGVSFNWDSYGEHPSGSHGLSDGFNTSHHHLGGGGDGGGTSHHHSRHK